MVSDGRGGGRGGGRSGGVERGPGGLPQVGGGAAVVERPGAARRGNAYAHVEHELLRDAATRFPNWQNSPNDRLS